MHDAVPAIVTMLPRTILDAEPTHGAMAVIVPGDGGWRDLDRTFGQKLSAQDMQVIGLDLLSHFWRLQMPNETAAPTNSASGALTARSPSVDRSA